MPRPIEQLPQIRSAIRFYRVMSWVTGLFLLLLVAEMVLKYSPTHVEVFAADTPGKEHFTTGPVVGFAVRDLTAAVAELRAAGVRLVGPPRDTSQHFVGPDGNVYELVAAEPTGPVGTDGT